MGLGVPLPPAEVPEEEPEPESEDEAEDSPVAIWLRGCIARQRSALDGAWKIDFRGQAEGDRALKALGWALPEGLPGLELELPPSAAVGDAGLAAIGKKLQSRTPGLVRFVLRCNLCDQITDQGVEAFCGQLQALSQLQDLSLDFALCAQLTDVAIDGLSALLAALGVASPEPAAAAAAAALTMSRPTSPAPVSSSASSATVAVPGTIGTQDESDEHNTSLLRRFALNLHGCKQLTDSSLTKFGESLISLTGIRSLDLGLAEPGDGVTVQGLRSVFAGISGMPDLEYLNLNCFGCAELYESGFINLCQALTPKDKLKDLTLDFYGCNAISSAGLTSFAEVFSHAPALEKVALKFTNCDKITGSGIEEVCGFLTKHQYLRKFVLHVGGTQVSRDAVPFLQNSMKHIEDFQVSFAIRKPLTSGVSVVLKR